MLNWNNNVFCIYLYSNNIYNFLFVEKYSMYIKIMRQKKIKNKKDWVSF